MAKFVVGSASSHAFALLDPEHWDDRRARNRNAYFKRFGVEPPEQPGVAAETPELVRRRFGNVRAALDQLRTAIAAKRPDALLLIGDDQNENYLEDNLPQFAIYTGARVKAVGRAADGRVYPCHAELAEALLEGCVEQGIDLAFSRRFPDEELRSHAHAPLLKVLTPEANVPIVPIFVNGLHHPSPVPARCYAFGQALRRTLDACLPGARIAVHASGGLSHFTAGYPWKHYQGPFGYGAISEAFDQQILGWMQRGEGNRLAALTSKDLLTHGEIELRSWIIMLGMLGDARATTVTYEPFYRAIMGMGVGYWDLEAAGAASRMA